MTDVKKQYFIGKKGASLGKASIFVKIALLLIVVIMLVMSVNMLMRYGELQDQKDALEKFRFLHCVRPAFYSIEILYQIAAKKLQGNQKMALKKRL